MKNLTFFSIVALLTFNSLAVKADDASFVANWVFPIFWGYPWTGAPTTAVEQKTTLATAAPTNFDPENCDFDAVWAGITTSNTIGNAVNNPSSDKGAADFSGAFKVLYDDDFMYILLQYTDDDITGSEETEIMWAQDAKIAALEQGTFATEAATNAIQYCRYDQFGGYKAAFTSVGFKSALTIDFNDHGACTLNFDGTNTILDNNISFKNYTVAGSKTVRIIYTLGYPVFTGTARPDFNTTVWSQLNSSKGISFDIKVKDPDADDQVDANNAALPAAYWWNSTDNNGYAITCYSGFLGVLTTDVKSATFQSSIYSKVSSTQIELKSAANVTIIDATGKEVMRLKNVDKVDVSNLKKGMYIVNANNQIMKFLR